MTVFSDKCFMEGNENEWHRQEDRKTKQMAKEQQMAKQMELKEFRTWEKHFCGESKN